MRWSYSPAPDLDRPFDGEISETSDPSLTSLLDQAKQTLTRQPRAEVTAAHVEQMAEAARGLAAGGQPGIVEVAPRRRGGLRALQRAAVSLAAVLFLGASSMVGLAYAGVQLPSAVLTAFNGVGIHLPNQGQGGHGSAQTHSPASSLQHGQDVRVIATTGPHGCAHGRAVSAAAGSRSQAASADGHRQNANHQTADPCAQGHQSGAGSQSQGTSAGAQHRDTGSSSSRTTVQTHRKPSGEGPSIPSTHGRSGKTGNQGKGKGGSQQPNEHSTASMGHGVSQHHGHN